ncbi:hypothetical protein EPI10_027776 [Gossypium australe]|uniref:Uncharacterized protein n=1 Tax=Gossypium australe TaxID=47621 RepID=A0A5B6UW36_9ROSI|nr:hypothetical protein EPI10_027776 [Gossypium australe]
MSDSSRAVTSEEMESHMPTQEQATITNNMGNNQEPQPQQPYQPQLEVIRLAQLAPLAPNTTELKFLGDKGDDPIVAKEWLSRLYRVVKELKCTSEDSL